MITFSLNSGASDIKYMADVWQTILSLKRYFYMFNKGPGVAEEAMQRTFINAVENRDEKYRSNLAPYIKKLARTIMKNGNNKEFAYSLYDDETGEVSFVFTQKLTTEIDTEDIDGDEALLEELRDLYLLMPEDFEKFTGMFNEESSQMQIIKNEELKKSIEKLARMYSSKAVFKGIETVLKECREEVQKEEEQSIKEITMREANYTKYEPRLCTDEGIQADNGEWGYINISTYKTEPFDPDMKKWSIKTTCPIIKCDISPLINYMYEKIFVQKGVSNDFIKWIGNRYKLTSPGGYVAINLDAQLFMDIVHKELIINMLRENINKIVAISDDSVYIKPTRGANINVIRVKLHNGKIIDLPCEIYKKGDK